VLRLVIHSRAGNGVLAVLGVIYFVSATATLAYYLVTNWGANGLIDYALQLALAAAAIGGIFFVATALGNLRSGASRKAPKADAQSSAPMSTHPAA